MQKLTVEYCVLCVEVSKTAKVPVLRRGGQDETCFRINGQDHFRYW